MKQVRPSRSCSRRSVTGFTRERGHHIPFPLVPHLPHPISWPTRIKSRRSIADCCRYRYRSALELKAPHVLFTTVSGVDCWGRTGGGSAGRRAHVPLSSLPVSLRFMSSSSTCLTIVLRAECFARLHPSCLGIPLPRMGSWSHLCTYVINFCHPFRVYEIFF